MNGASTRLRVIPTEHALLEELTTGFSTACRTLYQRMERGVLEGENLHATAKRMGFTAHQSNSIRFRVLQWRATDQGARDWRLGFLGETIAALEETVAALDTEIAALESSLTTSGPTATRRPALRTRDRLRSKRFQKHRRLCALRQQHKNLTNDPAAHRVFGSRKLLQQRSRLDAPDSPVADVSEWRTTWTTARNAEVWFVGAADQSFGNQSAQIDLAATTLTIRLTETQADRRLQAEADRLGIPVERVKNRLSFKRLTLTGVIWTGRPAQDLKNAQALGLPITVSIQRKLTPDGKRRLKRSLSLRPHKDWGWYVHAAFDLPPTPVAHSRHQGVLGVDVNAWGLAWAIATPDGNVMKDGAGKALKGNIELPFTKDTTSDQREALCRQAVVELTDLAQLHRVAIGAESLDFQTKRAGAREGGARTARMITQLRTNGFAEALTSRCRRVGVALHWVNPAWTSVSGFAKYGLRNALSIDQAAAFAIARKALLAKTWTAIPLPTHARTGTNAGKPLSKAFLNKLAARQRERLAAQVLNYHEPVRFAQPVPAAFQRKLSGPTADAKKLSWRSVGKVLGTNRSRWRSSLSESKDPRRRGRPAVSGGSSHGLLDSRRATSHAPSKAGWAQVGHPTEAATDASGIAESSTKGELASPCGVAVRTSHISSSDQQIN